MNEIMAEVDGEIVEICVANGQVVDYGSPSSAFGNGKEVRP